MGRRRGGRTLTPAALREVVRDEIGKAMSGAPRTAANPTGQQAMASTPDTFGQLAQLMRAAVGYRATPMARDPRDSGPFGPMHPVAPDPVSPARTDTGRPEPWLYEYPVAWNIPGAGERLMPWRVLDAAARNIDVIRRCIEIRKSRVRTAPWSWDISPQAIEDAYRADGTKGHDDIAAELRDRYRADINRLTEFWKRPWRAQGLDFGNWVGGVMEGRLKYDAVVIYPRTNLGGDTLLGLEIIDPTTIKPLLDYRGSRPEPPYPAYQQILYGFPRGEWRATPTEVDNGDGTTTTTIEGAFRADELVYLRENYQLNSPYGYGPTEQALVASRLWMRRQGWLLAEYTDGVTPQLIWELPLDATGGANLTPEQRQEWEASVNDALAGQTAERHRSKVGFPGMVPHLMPSVDERYKPDYDLFLLKLQCSFFGVPVSDLGFTETRGLGASGVHESQAENRADISTGPDLLFAAGLANDLGRRYQDAPAELVFSFTDNDGGQDEAQQSTIAVSYLGAGATTLNDTRRKLSLPVYQFPEADMPYVLGQGGPVFIEGSLAAGRRAQGLDENGKPLPASELPPGQGGAGGAQPGDNPGDKPAPARGDTAKAAAVDPPLCRRVRAQLAEDYPPDATMWVRDATWEGPVDVDPADIDFSDAGDWDASDDSKKVAKFGRLLAQPGKLKPAVFVRVPGKGKLGTSDGHHRALAGHETGRPVPGWIGTVPKGDDRWARMHSQQHAGGRNGEVDGVPVSAPPAMGKAVHSNDVRMPSPHEPSHEARAEIGAYRRWAAKAITGGRPFVVKHATPDDFPDGVPAGIEFADWVWLGFDDEILVKAYEPWWPRDARGKWIKRGSFAGLEDKIRELHGRKVAQRDKVDALIAGHGDKLRAAEARALTGDRAAHAEAATHRARIAELRDKRDRIERDRKDSAATVLRRHEAEQRKANRSTSDANRATVGTMGTTPPPVHVQAARDAYAQAASVPGQYVSLADVRDRMPDLSRAEQDAALRHLARTDRSAHLDRWDDQKVLSARERAAALPMGGRDNHVLRIDPPAEPAPAGDPVADMRAAYARVAQPGEWTSITSLRDRAPHLTHDQQSAALRALSQDPDVDMMPEANQKILTPRDRAGAIRVGGQDAHLIAINGGPTAGGAPPPSMTRPQVASPPSDVVAAKLRAVGSRDEAGRYLDGLGLKAADYRRIGRELDVPFGSGTSKAEMRRVLVEVMAGGRLDADGIMRNAGKAAAGDDPGKAPAPGETPPGAPQPPPDDRWPGWAVDTAIATAVGAALTAALTRGVDIRAVARAAARQWPDAAPSTGAVVAWLRARFGPQLAAVLTPAVEDALTEGYLVGARSAEAILDAGVDPRNPGITISVDWSHWRPGDARAARQILSADGHDVGLARLLAKAGVTIRGIAEQRLDELASVLADGLERGASPKEIAVALRGVVANPTWANTVAWTETARAQGAAASEIYAQRGVERNEWMNAHDQLVCPLCLANEAAGPVDVGAEFPSGDVHPPGHPRCRCALVPALNDLGKSVRAVATGHEGDAEQLHHYWTRGEGLAKWADSPHPFRALRRHLARYIHDPRELNATTAQWHHDALGFWPGKHKGK